MLKIRKILTEDKDIILEWRNHPEVYKFALSAEPVSRETHENWFKKILNKPDTFFYMGILDGKKCGTVRYDIFPENKTEAEVSISLSPEFWGRGIATELMKLGEEELKKESSVKIVHATVLNENKASLRLFEKSAFNPYLTKLKKEI